jgi:hypothetical protein
LRDEPTVRLGAIRPVYDALASAAEDGNFAVFLFGSNGTPPKPIDALNVQFSVENGRIGLDWVLLAPDNIAAAGRVRTFLTERGLEVQELEMNGVSYLRVEAENLPALCHDLLVSVFGVTTTQVMQLIPEGFEWPA